ncbi:glycosyltransferase family 4 protein [Flavobacterium psychrophilum]|uniref:glycosyltransferase family 4 protein n=1 Tax=Flavobacterium psychrophilum TaxID=96345 RepID=UPI0004F79B53|nr:glycosyltransferase family 1 protein [Flavobacterium psychrophilum]AIN74582.1 glycosyl transferase family 1 [Flavobacterium psychrophilum FPG3]EKT2068277.1 glycosyltransferase family 4 protein [Flavobacterium psychrophilum]EKT2072366.1 glycosyltransferase family 4 protein [Flavobacterium psychrophilum]EKT4491858.1 glycosyltransferase family 4 protein [Flavobacterium psychrophilum]ELI6456001.1 glycosyltransferase family 4 protein [Flavobacterium psychrophilum]
MNIGYEAKRIFHNKTGLGNYSRDLVRILATYYPKNSYFLYNPKKNKEALFTTNSPVIFEKLPTTSFYTKFYNLWRQKGIINDLEADKIELFHGLSGEIPSGLKSKNIKSVVTIHDLIFMRYPHLYSFLDRKIHYYKFKKSAKNANLIIAISQQTKEDIITYLKVPAHKIKVIYQGCQAVFKEKYSVEEKNKVTAKYNLPATFILNVGTIEERKNALTIVKAIKNIDTKLVLIGKKTAYADKIKTYIKENDIEEKVIFLQGLTSKELAITYQLATVFVYPSVFEGFGIPIIEALFSKTPVITTNSGVFPEAGGPNSIYINPNNAEDLKVEIEKLLLSEPLRNEISDKGFNFVQKFNDNLIAKEIMQCYESLF